MSTPEPTALTESKRAAWRRDSEHGGVDFCHQQAVRALREEVGGR